MDGTTRQNLVMAASYGDANEAVMSVTFAGEAIATVVDMGELPESAQVTEVVMVRDALGADSTLKVGYRSTDGSVTADDDAFLAAASSVSAGRAVSAIHPVEFTTPTLITITTGGAVVTGTVTLLVRYKYRGA